MANGNSMFLYGRNSVLERLKSDPKSVKKVLFRAETEDRAVMDIVRSKKIPVRRVSEKEAFKFRGSERTQGIMAEVDKFEYASFKGLLERPKEERLSFIFLDGVTDPQNLGAVLRIGACFGGFAVVIAEHRSCEVNETVLNVASGGENYVPVCKVTNISNALIHAKSSGYWLAGATVEGGEDIRKASLPFPICLVLGSEGKGLHYGVEKHLELKLTLPMGGAPLSFNVACACAIFCYEITRQRDNA